MADVFEGTSCVVTGGTSGIGFAVAEALLKRGAIVSAVGFPQESVDAAREKLASYENARCALVDVTDWDAVKGMVDEAVAVCGHLDYLFNNAGVGGAAPYEVTTLEHWKAMIDLNLWGVIYGVHAAFPVMLAQGSGHIVNTSSIAGLIPVPYQAVYCATKFAVAGMTESLRYEHEHRGIAFSTVCPGNVATPIFGDTAPPPDSISPEEAATIILAGVERKDGLIVLPERMRQWHRALWSDPERMDAEMREMADARRKAYAERGRYY
jgi:NAD(P)-dependent dehydrogenase (short-subunit alcohol dehydrogenase family)